MIIAKICAIILVIFFLTGFVNNLLDAIRYRSKIELVDLGIFTLLLILICIAVTPLWSH